MKAAKPTVQVPQHGRGKSLYPVLMSLVGINKNMHAVSGTAKYDAEYLNEASCLKSSQWLGVRWGLLCQT